MEWNFFEDGCKKRERNGMGMGEMEIKSAGRVGNCGWVV